jgi:hypothetical protein
MSAGHRYPGPGQPDSEPRGPGAAPGSASESESESLGLLATAGATAGPPTTGRRHNPCEMCCIKYECEKLFLVYIFILKSAINERHLD